jgi:hypothetical protein
VLRIYSYLSPIDLSGPIADRIRITENETLTDQFFVQPMAPKTHPLKVDWTLQVVATAFTPQPPEEAPPADFGESAVKDERADSMWQREGDRASARRSNPLAEGNPRGSAVKASLKKVPGGNAFRSTAAIPHLPPGIYRLTARVVDDTRVPKVCPYPWVLKDPDRLCEERRVWTIEVAPAAAAPAPAAPPAPPSNPPPPK